MHDPLYLNNAIPPQYPECTMYIRYIPTMEFLQSCIDNVSIRDRFLQENRTRNLGNFSNFKLKVFTTSENPQNFKIIFQLYFKIFLTFYGEI